MIKDRFPSISVESVFEKEISEESLNMAVVFYFGLVFCPDDDSTTVNFYQDLFERFSVEVILKTLARIMWLSRDRRLAEYYIPAKALLDRMTTSLDLQYKDIAVLTTQEGELNLFKELRSHQLTANLDTGRSFRSLTLK